MRITLSVLFATLTIYCSSSVLSLPPSLIAKAASLEQHYARQSRENDGAAAAASAADHLLLLQPSANSNSPLPHDGQAPRSKKNAKFLPDGRSGYTNTHTDSTSSSDDIARLTNYELNNHVSNELTPQSNTISGSKLAVAAAKDAHERHNGHGMTEYNRKLPVEYDLNAMLASAAGRFDLQRNAAQQTRKQQQQHAVPLWQQYNQPGDVAARIRAMQMKEFFTPLKYWAHHCQPPDHNCPQKYHRALLADRSKAAAAAAKQMDEFTPRGAEDAMAEQTTNAATADDVDDDDDVNINAPALAFGGGGGVGGDLLANFNDDTAVDNVYNNADAIADMFNTDGGNDDDNEDGEDDYDEDNNAGNDILMLLSGEQDVMKFLSWAMQQLYPYQHFANISSNSGSAEYYHPGMFNWKKLNLSGNIEPPLVVEEPRYVIVRRERLEDDQPSGIRSAERKSKQRSSPYQSAFNLNYGPQYKDDPFIPPRGRKHNLPDLDALLNRYETFVPNRGRRDKIKDIFKYDDLFFPNRGKKQKPSKATTKVALNDGQWQRNYDDESNEITRAIEDIDAGVGESGRQLDNPVDGCDDSNLTAPPASVVKRGMLGGQRRYLRSHKLNLPFVGSEGSDNDDGTIGISFDKNSDDIGNNYSDTIDNNLAASGDGNGDGADTAAAALGWSQSAIDASDVALTKNQINENDDRSVKSSVPQIGAINMLTAAMAVRPAAIAPPQQQWRGASNMNARMRRMPSTFDGATRIAANRLRSMSAETQRQQVQRLTRQQLQEHAIDQQKSSTKATLRYFSRRLRHEQIQKQLEKKQAQRRRAAWQLSSSSNQVRGSGNDLDPLSWRQLHQSDKPLIVQHPRLAWLQHLPLRQEAAPQQQMQLQLQQHLLGRVNGVAAGRNPPEITDADRIFFNI